MATQEKEEGTEMHGTGIGERVTGGMKRAAGAIGRAARGVMGQPEAGTDLLFQQLHAEHEQVSTLFAKMLATEDEQKCRQLWQMICVNLTAHARAEQEVIYSRLTRSEETREDVGHAYEEHADIERMIAECDAQSVGSEEFYAMAAELEQVVRHHVDDEEGDLLPKAAQAISEDERDQLVMRFQERKVDLMPEILEEFGAGGQRKQQRGQQAGKQRGGRASSGRAGAERRRSAKRSGQQGTSSRGRGNGGQDRLNDKTVDELRQMASQKDIPGRSKMGKRELVNALRRA